jgi:hypothetical protein
MAFPSSIALVRVRRETTLCRPVMASSSDAVGSRAISGTNATRVGCMQCSHTTQHHGESRRSSSRAGAVGARPMPGVRAGRSFACYLRKRWRPAGSPLAGFRRAWRRTRYLPPPFALGDPQLTSALAGGAAARGGNGQRWGPQMLRGYAFHCARTVLTILWRASAMMRLLACRARMLSIRLGMHSGSMSNAVAVRCSEAACVGRCFWAPVRGVRREQDCGLSQPATPGRSCRRCLEAAYGLIGPLCSNSARDRGRPLGARLHCHCGNEWTRAR